MLLHSLTNLHGTVMIWGHSVHSRANKIHSSLSPEITFDTHFYKPKIGHLIVDIIHRSCFTSYLSLTITPNNLAE